MMNDTARNVARIVRSVCAAAVRDADAEGIVVLDDWTPEGELVYEWLVDELSEDRVWRAASTVPNLSPDQDRATAALRFAFERAALVAHPANRTALLLGGRLPWADLFPLGDIPAGRIEALVGRWSGPPALEALAARAGLTSVDAALERAVDARMAPAEAFVALGDDVARQVLEMYEQGRYFRLRPRVVPKLGARTLGIDLFD